MLHMHEALAQETHSDIQRHKLIYRDIASDTATWENTQNERHTDIARDTQTQHLHGVLAQEIHSDIQRHTLMYRDIARDTET